MSHLKKTIKKSAPTVVITWKIGEAIRERKHQMSHFTGNGIHLLRCNKLAWWSVTFIFSLQSSTERASFRPSTQVNLSTLLDLIRLQLRKEYDDEFMSQVKDISALIVLRTAKPKS